MKPQVVSFHCVLKTATGRLVSTTYSRDVLTEAPPGQAADLPGLARNMKDLHDGEKRQIRLDAVDAYGLYDPALVLRIPRSRIPGKKRLRRGDEVELPTGESKWRTFRVDHVGGEEITLDANHPLAGQDLVFDIEVVTARIATEDDIRAEQVAVSPTYLN